MSSNKFLRLANNLVNTSFIKNVEIYQDPPSFRIKLQSEIVGNMFFFYPINNSFFISKDKAPRDYETVAKWVEEMSTNYKQ